MPPTSAVRDVPDGSATPPTSGLAPLNATHRDALRAFFAAQGTPVELVDWKYFDDEFNRGRTRGVVWARDGRIDGFLGLIPFEVGEAGSSSEAAWVCDWRLADPRAAPGMGLRIMRRSFAEYEQLFALGGIATSRSFVTRLSGRNVQDAAVSLHHPLRLGALLGGAARRFPIAAPLDRPVLRNLPVPSMHRRRTSGGVVVADGVAPQIGPLLAEPWPARWSPRYDLAFVAWAIGRCPALESWTCHTEGAAALLWKARGSRDHCRLRVWWRSGAEAELEAAIGAAAATAYHQRATTVSVLASHLDREILAALRQAGFRTSGARMSMCHLPPPHRTSAIDELAGLSYLDTDLAYRF